MHIEALGYRATAPSAGAAAAAVTGDSLAVKNNIGEKSPRIIAGMMKNQTAGYHQLTWPSGHDTTRGLRLRVPAAEPDNRIPLGLGPHVQAQEALTVQIAGSAVAGDIEQGCLLMHYPNLPGISQRLIDWDDLQRRIEQLLTVEFTLALDTTGDWSGSELITAESDLLRANRDYAVLGSVVSAGECTALSIKGPDTGNVRVGMHGNTEDAEFAANFFPILSRAYRAPFIPVISSGNKASTYLEGLTDENGTDVVGSLFLALLKR